MTEAGRDVMGRVEWTDAEGPRVATLHWDGHWSVTSDPPRGSDALLALRLDDLYLDSYLATGPADGYPGFRELAAAAEYLGGKAIPSDPEPGSGRPGVVY